MGYSVYLSANKLVLLVAIDQYSRHYDWGPSTLTDMAQFLVTQLCEPALMGDWQRVEKALDDIYVDAEEKTLREMLVKRVEQVLQSIDALHGFFDSLGRLVVNVDARPAEVDDDVQPLDSESLFGIFVRRCRLAFDQLEFHQVGQFYEDCQQAILALNRQNPASSDNRTPQPLPQQAELELREHVEQLISILETESGASLPKTMEQQIRDAATQLHGHARLHYLSYLHHVRAGESEQSEAALRRFFDSSNDNSGARNNGRSAHQYALLYLAAMRTRLGIYDAARQALTEATHVARDCQDHTCLLFIVCWESRLQLSSLNRNVAERPYQLHRAHTSLAALIDKATAMGNYELQTMGHLQLADLLASTKADARLVFRSLQRAQALDIEHSVQRQRVPCYLAAAQAWLLHDCPWLAQLCAQMAQQHAKETSAAVLSEREHAQSLRMLMRCESDLCGVVASRQPTTTQLRFREEPFVDPALADDVAETAEWLDAREECAEPHSAREERASLPSNSTANCLRRARKLADDGYLCEAQDILLSIVCSPDTTATAAMQAAAQKMLAALE
ncbi:APC5 protein [Coemansia sp. RSA 988]|nr:APC5 protein [Coemansia sp. RSA 988]